MSQNHHPVHAQSTAAEVIAGVDLTGRRAIVTGGASGIGLETARALADAGAEVTLAVRDTAAGERAAADITAATGNEQVRVAHLDLADRATIDAFTAGWTGPLHILVNNAGIMALPELTTDRRRLGDAVRHQPPRPRRPDPGPARRARRRRRRPRRRRQLVGPPAVPGRLRRHPLHRPALRGVVGVRPVEDRHHPVHRRPGQEVGRRRHHRQRPAPRRHHDQPAAPPRRRAAALRRRDGRAGRRLEVPPGWKTPQQGAATSVLLAASPAVEGVTGRYFEDAHEAGRRRAGRRT